MPAHDSTFAHSAQWRPMTKHDLDAVPAIAAIGFPDHYEGPDIFANRLALFPAGCFALADGNGQLAGYIIAYPWTRDSVPTLNQRIEAIPRNAEIIYLHDLVVLPEVRGLGLARTMVEQLVMKFRAEEWPAVGLVAVNNAAAFWMRLGFYRVETPARHGKLGSYGAGSSYMVRELR